MALPLMHIVNNLLACLVGMFCWGITLVLSDGVAPLGNVGGTEGLLFFIPVLIFSIPLAVSALNRGRTGTGLWLIALAPVFGFANFALALGLSSHAAVGDGPSGLVLLVVAAGWAALLGVCLLILKAVTPA
jgi:hypothetical protein